MSDEETKESEAPAQDTAPPADVWIKWTPGRGGLIRNERGLTLRDLKALGIEDPVVELWWREDNGHMLAKEPVKACLGVHYARVIEADPDFIEVAG